MTTTPQRRVTMALIRRLALQIAHEFQPERIILFGSHAYGQPRWDSDVDLLVVMPARNERSQASRIRARTEHPFALDLIVRTPENLRKRLAEGDWFLREIMAHGKVLYAETREGPGEPNRVSGRPRQGSLAGRLRGSARLCLAAQHLASVVA